MIEKTEQKDNDDDVEAVEKRKAGAGKKNSTEKKPTIRTKGQYTSPT